MHRFFALNLTLGLLACLPAMAQTTQPALEAEPVVEKTSIKIESSEEVTEAAAKVVKTETRIEAIPSTQPAATQPSTAATQPAATQPSTQAADEIDPFAKLRHITDTNIYMIPPKGFKLSKVGGLEHPPTHSHIKFHELKLSIRAARLGLGPDVLAKRGITIISSERLTVNNHKAMLVIGTQNNAGQLYEKQMFVIGDDKFSALIVANYPQLYTREMRGMITDSLLSTFWSTRIPTKLALGLSFTISPPPGLPLKLDFRRGDTLFYSPEEPKATLFRSDKTSEDLAAERQLLFFAGGPHALPASHTIEKQGEFLLKRMPHLKNIVIQKSDTLMIGETEALKLVANATNKHSNEEIVIYQVIIPKDDKYYHIFARAGKTRPVGTLDKFEQATQSFKFAE